MTPFDIIFFLATKCFVETFAVLLILVAGFYALKRQPVTSLTFVGFGGVLVAGEGASIYFTHKTISENHWLMDANDPNSGMIAFLLLTLIFLVIVVHLGKLTIDRYRSKDKP